MIHISITHPKPSQYVAHKVRVQGEITEVKKDTILRTITFPQSMQTYHPQTGQMAIDFDQKVYDTVTFVGSAEYGSNTGEQFRIMIVSCTESADEKLNRYLETASRSGWPGILQLPDGCREKAEVSVIRDDYNSQPYLNPPSKIKPNSIGKFSWDIIEAKPGIFGFKIDILKLGKLIWNLVSRRPPTS